MKVTVNKFEGVALWGWNLKPPTSRGGARVGDDQDDGDDQDEDDDVCGICRVAYDGCCPDCKTPGDGCPLSKHYLFLVSV